RVGGGVRGIAARGLGRPPAGRLIPGRAGDPVAEPAFSALYPPPVFLHQGRHFRPKTPFPPLPASGVAAGNPVIQTVPDALFALSAAAAVLLSAAVVLARNPVRSTLLLILSFLPVSLLYVLMRAGFA